MCLGLLSATMRDADGVASKQARPNALRAYISAHELSERDSRGCPYNLAKDHLKQNIPFNHLIVLIFTAMNSLMRIALAMCGTFCVTGFETRR